MIPDIPGKDDFQGEISHSHDYRCPEPFTDKVILFLGAGPSGQDIALDIAPVAKKVNICPSILFLPASSSSAIVCLNPLAPETP